MLLKSMETVVHSKKSLFQQNIQKKLDVRSRTRIFLSQCCQESDSTQKPPTPQPWLSLLFRIRDQSKIFRCCTNAAGCRSQLHLSPFSSNQRCLRSVRCACGNASNSASQASCDQGLPAWSRGRVTFVPNIRWCVVVGLCRCVAPCASQADGITQNTNCEVARLRYCERKDRCVTVAVTQVFFYCFLRQQPWQLRAVSCFRTVRKFSKTATKAIKVVHLRRARSAKDLFNRPSFSDEAWLPLPPQAWIQRNQIFRS